MINWNTKQVGRGGELDCTLYTDTQLIFAALVNYLESCSGPVSPERLDAERFARSHINDAFGILPFASVHGHSEGLPGGRSISFRLAPQGGFFEVIATLSLLGRSGQLHPVADARLSLTDPSAIDARAGNIGSHYYRHVTDLIRSVDPDFTTFESRDAAFFATELSYQTDDRIIELFEVKMTLDALADDKLLIDRIKVRPDIMASPKLASAATTLMKTETSAFIASLICRAASSLRRHPATGTGMLDKFILHEFGKKKSADEMEAELDGFLELPDTERPRF